MGAIRHAEAWMSPHPLGGGPTGIDGALMLSGVGADGFHLLLRSGRMQAGVARKVVVRNMLHIVLNNGVNESVGGQPSAGYLIDLTTVAKACGYRTVGHAVETKEELQQIVREKQSAEMPLFIDVHVRQGIRSDMPKLNINHKAQKEALMRNLGARV